MWAKESLKFSYGGPSQRQASGTNQQIKALRQDHHWVWGQTHRCAIKEKNHSYKPWLGIQPLLVPQIRIYGYDRAEE